MHTQHSNGKHYSSPRVTEEKLDSKDTGTVNLIMLKINGLTLFLKALPMNTGTNFRAMVALRIAPYVKKKHIFKHTNIFS